jgi:hypothetical protein
MHPVADCSTLGQFDQGKPRNQEFLAEDFNFIFDHRKSQQGDHSEKKFSHFSNQRGGNLEKGFARGLGLTSRFVLSR